MCSWCWAFKPVYTDLCAALADRVVVIELLGGLAADSDQTMPEDMQHYLQQTWKTIQQRVPGTRFDFAFWSQCRPVRSTYPACRAVIAARRQGVHYAAQMINAIQTAYYTEARNPSEHVVLMQLAAEIGLDETMFTDDINATATQQQLLDEIGLCRRMNVDSYPSLLLDLGGSCWRIPVDYNDTAAMLAVIEKILENEHD